MDYLGVNDSQPFVWLHGVAAGVLSTVLDNFATAINFFSLPDEMGQTGLASELSTVYSCNGLYWRVVAFCVMAGGNILGIGTMSGLALMKMERMHVGWFFRHVGWKALVGGIIGLGFLWLMQ